MIIALTLLVIFLFAINVIGYLISSPNYRGPMSDHFNGRRFTNPTGIKSNGLGSVIKWAMNREKGKWKEIKDLEIYDTPPRCVEKGLSVTFVNHSTFLIQVDGLNIVTDPVWSKRTSPFSFMGPKRMRPPGIPLEALPPIDVVLITHNHYDHLDIPTLKKIVQVHNPRIITPLGVKALLAKKGIAGTADLDWWDEFEINETLKVVATPAQHFSSRGTFDRDATLWCGYLIKRKAGNIYFAGDTGYNSTTFNEIGERFNPIQLAFIPIGAYKPEWFMSPIHCSPKEAVQIHKEIQSEQSIAMHFGTFPLADEGKDDPRKDLEMALKENNIPSNKFILLEEGKAKGF